MRSIAFTSNSLLTWANPRAPCGMRPRQCTKSEQEKKLQDDQAPKEGHDTAHREINKALHALVAHLYRFKSELASIQACAATLAKLHCEFSIEGKANPSACFIRINEGLGQVISQFEAFQNFEIELEKKAQNNLALVSGLTGKESADS